MDMERSNQLPQPRTIAPSKEDVLSNLAFFFGEPNAPEKLRDYSEQHAMTCARYPFSPNPTTRTPFVSTLR